MSTTAKLGYKIQSYLVLTNSSVFVCYGIQIHTKNWHLMQLALQIMLHGIIPV